MSYLDSTQPPWYVILLLFMAAVGVFGSIACVAYDVGKIGGRQEMMNEAVRNYKAEYYLDDNNQRQWRWKP